MSKGIFCENCPIRTRSGVDEELRPIGLGESAPVDGVTARHHLSHNIEAARYQTVDANGNTVGNDATVIAPAGMDREVVTQMFESCQQPSHNELTLWKLRIPLGNICLGHSGIEEQAYLIAARQDNR